MREGAGLSSLFRRSSTMMAIGVVAILVVMVIPLPTVVLDILLSFNMALSIIIMLMAMYTLKPLDFSTFPSILLVVTLLRLSLNVASTRLILLHGSEGTSAAGQVIKAFGTFVVGGNYVVGMVVFSVLVLINFVVITKGSTRVAEVAARFTLDAMPGKQMSIDADMNAGLITEAEAKLRRAEIEREANFYGAMDGASKFVRGDAVAGILIVLVNSIGGLIIGVMQQGMEVAQAAKTYVLLTVGDGLVTQVPALIVSTAAGMLVTRTTSTSDLGEDVKKQVFTQPRAIATAAALLFLFAMIPGMPKFSFVLVAALIAVLAYNVFKQDKAKVREEEAPTPPAPQEEEILTPLDKMGLEVGYGLIPLVDVQQGGELLQRIKTLRRQLAQEMGFIIPSIHIRDNLQLKPNRYAFYLKGTEVASGELMLGHYLAITNEEGQTKVMGIKTTEPAFGLPAVWVPEGQKDDALAKGYVVVDPATVLTTHLTEVVKSQADELLGRQEVQALIDNLAQHYPKIVDELVPKVVPLGILQRVLQRLLKERVSIRDLLAILETMADYIAITKNIDILTGYVRQALSRTITRQYQDQAGNVNVLMLSPTIEDTISQSIQHTEYESFASPDPNMVKRVIDGIRRFMDSFEKRGLPPVVLCSPLVRGHLRRILEKFIPNIVVLAHNEITRDANIRSLGVVEI